MYYFYDFYSANPDYFGYTLVVDIQRKIRLNNNHRAQGYVRYINYWYRASHTISRVRHLVVTDLGS
jgi:hypothetical protein